MESHKYKLMEDTKEGSQIPTRITWYSLALRKKQIRNKSRRHASDKKKAYGNNR
jgi:hypothetical protein